MRCAVYLAGALLLGIVSPSHAAGDAARGEQLYEARCTGCHSLDASRIGPQHRGVFGRKAGGVPDYDYSAAVKRSKLVWGEKTLGQWLTNPEQVIPGQKMGYRVEAAADRADLVAFLRREAGK
jgi:cytochrome c